LSPNFRVAVEEEVPQLARLGAHSFPAVGRSISQWEEKIRSDPRGGPDVAWVAAEPGGIAAFCSLFRFRQWIGGERIPIVGVASVAIAPTHRRRGLAGALVSSGFRHAVDRGDVASALYPFRTRFYARLGYGMAGEAVQYQFPPEALPDAAERAAVRLVDRATDLPALRRVYDTWAPRDNGQLERADHSWGRVLEGDREAVLYQNARGDAEGYLVFRYPTGESRAGRVLEVEEVVWTTAEARRGLYGWLGSLGDQWREIVYRAHPDEGFAERLNELRHGAPDARPWHFWFPAATVQMGPMFRLLDVERAFALRRIAPGVELTLGLEVADEQLASNRGSWRLRMEDGSIRAERASGPAQVTLSLGIDTLSRLFVGALGPSAAVSSDLARIDRPDLLPTLDAALRLRRPWMFDRF
jgi:predicted acetyltransferase